MKRVAPLATLLTLLAAVQTSRSAAAAGTVIRIGADPIAGPVPSRIVGANHRWADGCGGDRLTSFHNAAHPDAVTTTTTIEIRTNSGLSHTFPAHSITLIEGPS
jgi:hypothetical protein